MLGTPLDFRARQGLISIIVEISAVTHAELVGHLGLNIVAVADPLFGRATAGGVAHPKVRALQLLFCLL